jgi:hypothetical protein
MGEEVGNKGSETPMEQVAPPATVSIPGTLDDIKQLESSIMVVMHVMLAGFHGPKENPTPSAGTSPSKAYALNPLIEFVPAKRKPLEEEKVGHTGTSTPKGNEDPMNNRDSEDSHAVPPPNNYTPSLHIPMHHIVS